LGTPDGRGIMICPESGWRYQEVEPGVLRCLDWPEGKPLVQKGEGGAVIAPLK
jgi:UDP-2-acetamido-3-amino-2,3-dideoxy-glucuronate N-acetyltransferase